MAKKIFPNPSDVAEDDSFGASYAAEYQADAAAEDDAWLRSLAGEDIEAAPTTAAPAGDAGAPVDLGNDFDFLGEPTDIGMITPEREEDEGAGLWDYVKAVGSGGLSIAGDLALGAGEAVPQAFGGIMDAFDEAAGALQDLIPMPGVQLFDEDGNFDPSWLSASEMTESMDADKTLLDLIAPKDARTVTGGLVRSTAQFLTGFLPGMKAARGIGLGKIAAGFAAGAIADAVVFDPHEARLSTWLNEVPYLEAIVPDYLADHDPENQTAWEGRLKNAIEGAGLGAFAEGLFATFKYYKAQRLARGGKAHEEQGAIAQAARDEQKALAEAEIGNQVDDRFFENLGDMADDAPLYVMAKPDETLAIATQRIRDASSRAAQMEEQGVSLARINEIVESKKRKIDQDPGVERIPTGETTREAIDDALDELRSGAVSKAKFPARPVAAIVRGLGGVDPASSLAADLRSRGITAQSFPGLFSKKAGIDALDNIPGSEHALFVERNLVGPDGYVNEQAFIDGLEAELKGEPWRLADEQRQIDELVAPAQELDEQLSRLGIDYDNMSNDAVKARLKEIADEQDGWRRFQEENEARISQGEEPRTYGDLDQEQRDIWTAEQTAEARALGIDEAVIASHQPNKVYINMARIRGAEDVKELIQLMANADADNIKRAQRGVVSNKQTAAEAKKEFENLTDILARPPAGTWNAAQMVAARQVLASSAEQVMQLAKIASQPNAGKVDLYNFRRAASVHAAIQAEVIGARTEAARALQSWSMPVGSNRARTDAVNELLANNMGGDLQKLAKSISNVSDEAAIGDLTRQLVGMRKRDMLYSVYVNAILSGPKTHLVNAMSNAAVAVYAIPERYVAETFSNAFGKGDVAKGEAAAMAYGMMQGVRDGVRMLTLGPKAAGIEDLSTIWNKFGQGEGRMNPISGAAMNLDPGSAIYRGLDAMGKVLNLSGTMLEKGDIFFKAVNYRMELHALAYREAKLAGLEGKEFAEKVADILRNPPENLSDQASKFAMINTFTNPLGEVGRNMQKTISQTELRWSIPFVRTPTNLLKFTFSRTPLALFNSRIRADLMAGGVTGAQTAAKIGMGSMLMSAFAGHALDGNITGGGPVDPALNRAWRDAGNQPYSVKIGGRWFSYSRLDPLGMLIGMTADIAEIRTNPRGDASDEMIIAAGLNAFVQTMTSKTYMQGLFDLAEAVDGRGGGSIAQYLNKTGTSLIPFSSALRQMAQGMDMTMRESRDEVTDEFGSGDPVASYINRMINDFKRGMPGMSSDLPPVRDMFGEPMTRESGLGTAWDMIMPIQSKSAEADPVAKAIFDNEVSVPHLQRQINGINLSAEQYDQFQVIAGGYVREFLDQLVSSSSFKDMSDGPDGMKAEMIKRFIGRARDMARKEMVAGDPDLRDKTMNKRELNQNRLIGVQ